MSHVPEVEEVPKILSLTWPLYIKVFRGSCAARYGTRVAPRSICFMIGSRGWHEAVVAFLIGDAHPTWMWMLPGLSVVNLS